MTDEVNVSKMTGNPSPFAGLKLLLVAAHPDDEVFFAGSQLSDCRSLIIVHITDGANSKTVAKRKGFKNRAEYALARRRELSAALDAGGIYADCQCLWHREQYSCLSMTAISRELARIIQNERPDVILTHAYEGGHRDHDTAAFATRMAADISAASIPIWEMACYHDHNGHPQTHRFPPTTKNDCVTMMLTETQRQIKQRMIACFHTQPGALRMFGNLEIESFRVAPRHDFTRPPTDGRLRYEVTDTQLDSALWRLLTVSCSREALAHSAIGTRAALLKWAMYLMIATSRIRANHPRISRSFESLLFRVASHCTGPFHSPSHCARR